MKTIPYPAHFPPRKLYAAACILGLTLGVTALAAPAPAMAASGDIRLETKLGQDVLLAGKAQRVFLRVSLEGLVRESRAKRSPVNIALVLDRSGSMRGKKMDQAKEAAMMAINHLGRNDVVSVVVYNQSVKTLVSANWLRDRKKARALISHMTADGKTALHAGVKSGLREVNKFLSPSRVNRVILLSDGLANVGPSTPAELAELGRKAGGDGVSITTIGLGLGYNEDLMTRLAGASDGNHAFVEKAEDLVAIFNKEFGDVMSVAAQDVEIIIHCAPGLRPLRVLGRTAKISGQDVKMRLNQVYGGQQKYALLELEIPAGKRAGTARLADISVSYINMRSKAREALSGVVEARFSTSAREAKASTDRLVMSSAAAQIATLRSEQAVLLRDKGDTRGARRLLQENAAYLKQKARQYSAPALEKLGAAAAATAGALSDRDWGRSRKVMRARQYKSKNQQSY